MNIILGILIPFAGTAAGAACVFFMKDRIQPLVQKMLLGFASGVMVAASVWSLLIPAMDMAADMGKFAFVPAAAGFLLGIAFLLLMDRLVPHLHMDHEEPEGLKSSLKKTTMLVLAVTLHNIPEGMAVGVVFAGMLQGGAMITVTGAFALSIGIAIQNFPEGAIISMPLKSEGLSRSGIRDCGTPGSGGHRSAGVLHYAGSSLSAGLCSRGHDLRGGGGADPRVGGGRTFQYRHHRFRSGLCADDDPGRSFGMKTKNRG